VEEGLNSGIRLPEVCNRLSTNVSDLESDVKPDADGWITLHVTRLAFPPWCAECGAPTLEKQPFRVHHQAGFALILVPVCETCQVTIRRGYRSAFWPPLLKTLGVVALVAFVVGTVPAITGWDPKSFPILPILAGCAGVFITLPFAWLTLKRRALAKVPPPVEFRRYVKNHCVTFRFRRPEYLTDVLAILPARPANS
jgi:hypothetical protein